MDYTLGTVPSSVDGRGGLESDIMTDFTALDDATQVCLASIRTRGVTGVDTTKPDFDALRRLVADAQHPQAPVGMAKRASTGVSGRARLGFRRRVPTILGGKVRTVICESRSSTVPR